MGFLNNRVRDYLTKPLRPHAAFQVSPHYVSGIVVSAAERKIKSHFIAPLKPKMIEPSFRNPNVQDGAYFEGKIREGAEKLHLAKARIACLVPESCCKIFVLSFPSFPSTQKEKEEIIRWQVKKQMPMLPDDVRFSSRILEANNQTKVLVSLARSTVIREYEGLFQRAGLKVRMVGVPTLSLLNLVASEEDHNLLILNLEEEYISLIAVVEGGIVLYRLKPMVLETSKELSLSEKTDYVVTEVENTINFVQDKEKAKIHSLWVRLAITDPAREAFSMLRKRLQIPLEGVDRLLPEALSLNEKQILSPLAGKIVTP